MQRIVSSLLILSLISGNEALRFLVCFPVTTKSHSILGHGVVDRLLEAGHEVVHITSFPREKAVPKLREINVYSIGDDFEHKTSKDGEISIKNMIGKGNIADTSEMLLFGFALHKNMIELKEVKELLSDPKEKFDAVIFEWFYSELQVGIPALFQTPLIWVCSTEPHWQTLRLVDEVPNPAYNVELSAMYTAPLGFWRRTEQLWKTTKKFIIGNLIASSLEHWTYNSIYPDIAAKRGIEMPSYRDALYNGSFMLINSHASIGGAMKLPQNAVNIAGYHIPTVVKPLPKDLQTIMDKAKGGVIYMSLGSFLRSDGMPEEMTKSLFKMFSKLDQTVIFKFESDVEDVPANVHLVKWAPQQSILAHPNLKLFITHGGQLSTTEAIHFGVPVVGIPLLGDQYLNMKSVERKGFGILVKLAEDLVDKLGNAIRKILTENSYKIRAKELSSIFHDRPVKPGAELVYWVEYVVRTRGAPHLRSPALTVSFYQRLYLDLLALIVVVALLIRKLVIFLLKYFRNRESTIKRKNE